MSDFKPSLSRFGFSTGALERGNYAKALSWMCHQDIRSIELSALRYDELEPLVEHLDGLDLTSFTYVSFHAPSSFPRDKEQRVLDLLKCVSKKGWNIIVHPDVIYTPHLWKFLGKHLLIENMDRRKSVGRTARELSDIFGDLPQARLCLDMAHARQMDTTLTSLWDIIHRYHDRIAEIHISELDSNCQHRPMSEGAVSAYQSLAGYLHHHTHVIIESMLDKLPTNLRMEELHLAQIALSTAHASTNAKRTQSGKDEYLSTDEDIDLNSLNYLSGK